MQQEMESRFKGHLTRKLSLNRFLWHVFASDFAYFSLSLQVVKKAMDVNGQ